MPTIQIQAELSLDALLRAAEQLNESDLEQFVAQVVALRARRQAPVLPRDEAELLIKINQAIPPELQSKYDALIAKRDAEVLTPDEHQQLVSLSDEVEQREAKRVELLAELARRRNTSLTALLQELGIWMPVDD